MKEEYLAGNGYLELGMPDEARQAFESVPPGDSLHSSACAELMALADYRDVAEQNREAEEGLKMILDGCRDSKVINATALRLHFAGRTLEAYNLTADYAEFLDWEPIDHYGMATYASQIGEWEEAAAELVEGMQSRLSPSYSHMLADRDLEPLFRHAAEGQMDLPTALCIANPLFAAAVQILAATEAEVDGTLFREMPQSYEPFLKKEFKYSGHYFLNPCAPDAVRRDFNKWFDGIRNRITAWARQGITRANTMVLDAQMDFAIAAAKRGDFLAARHHTAFAASARPELFAEFDRALSPIGMAYLFDDVRAAWQEDQNFRKLMQSVTPLASSCPRAQMENLDECSTAAKATTFWILGRAVVARDLEGDAVARDWNIEVIRRWPDDPAAFHNLLFNYGKMELWDAADLVLANVPPAFQHLRGAESLRKSIESRNTEWSKSSRQFTPFYGQPDLGGIVKSIPAPETTPDKRASGIISKIHVDQTPPETSEKV